MTFYRKEKEENCGLTISQSESEGKTSPSTPTEEGETDTSVTTGTPDETASTHSEKPQESTRRSLQESPKLPTSPMGPNSSKRHWKTG